MGKIKFKFFSSTSLEGIEYICSLLNILDSNTILCPNFFGKYEPNYKYSNNKVIKLWSEQDKYPMIIFQREEPYLCWFTIQIYYPDIFNYIYGEIDENYVNDISGANQLISEVTSLFLWSNAVYGYVCHEQEYRRQNVFIISGGDQLQNSLPGIYWANFFGKVYIQFFSEDSLLTSPAYKKEILPDGSILLLTAALPRQHRLWSVQKLKRLIRQHLGKNAFYDKYHPFKRGNTPEFRFESTSISPPKEYIPYYALIPNPKEFILSAHDLALNIAAKWQLDFTITSLHKLDNLLLRSHSNDILHDSDSLTVFRECVAYYGEIYRKYHHAIWKVTIDPLSSEQHPIIQFSYKGRKATEDPVVTILNIWGKGFGEEGDTTESRFPS